MEPEKIKAKLREAIYKERVVALENEMDELKEENKDCEKEIEQWIAELKAKEQELQTLKELVRELIEIEKNKLQYIINQLGGDSTKMTKAEEKQFEQAFERRHELIIELKELIK